LGHSGRRLGLEAVGNLTDKASQQVPPARHSPRRQARSLASWLRCFELVAHMLMGEQVSDVVKGHGAVPPGKFSL
jgi:hypothetical protein